MAFDFSKFTSMLNLKLDESEVKTLVGVDIGSSAIKVVQLRRDNDIATLDTYGELQLGPYGEIEIGRTVNLPLPKSTEAFVDIVREASVVSSHVSLAISTVSSFVTILNLDTEDQKRMASLIPVEARKYIPVPINEVTLDWFPVSQQSDKGKSKVLLAAIHNDALQKYRTVVANANLKTSFTEIEIFSTIRSVMSQTDNTIAVVDLGAGSTKLYIATKGVIGRSHSLRMSGQELTQTLASALQIEFEKAEEIKRQYGLHGEGVDERVTKVFAGILNRGFREIHQVIERHAREEGVAVDRVVLTGGGALLKGVDVYAADILQRPVELANPFTKVSYPAFLEDTLREAGPSFSVALGAALRLLTS
jgi:type IV pilus assembly protein PilM